MGFLTFGLGGGGGFLTFGLAPAAIATRQATVVLTSGWIDRHDAPGPRPDGGSWLVNRGETVTAYGSLRAERGTLTIVGIPTAQVVDARGNTAPGYAAPVGLTWYDALPRRQVLVATAITTDPATWVRGDYRAVFEVRAQDNAGFEGRYQIEVPFYLR